MLTFEEIRDNIVAPLVPAGPFATVDVEPEFSKKVRSASVLLKANNPISYEDIQRATSGEYYRVALRIASKKYPQFSTVIQEGTVQKLQDESKVFTYQWLEDEVLAMLGPAGVNSSLVTEVDRIRLASFSGGIEWAVSKLVAAHVIRNIPLNNASLKFVDVANNLETQALEDIDRISELSQISSSRSPSNSTSSLNQEHYTLYIAHALDLATIPSSSFDIPDINSSPLTYNEPVSISNVTTYQSISVPTNKLSYCHIHMTAQTPVADQDLIGNRLVGANTQLHPQTSNGVSYSIRINIPMLNGWTIDDIISELADNINSACLSAGTGNTTLSNILVTPNRGRNQVQKQSAVKGELYPTSTTNITRTGTFDLIYRLNNLSFTPRRYSAKVSTEMMTITFFTIDNPDPSPNPIDSTNNPPIYENPVGTTDALSTIKKNSSGFQLGIEGLVHGPQATYGALDKTSPKGFFLTVQKGDKPSVSIESAGGSSSATPNFKSEDTENTLDTFYFYGDDSYIFPSNSILTFRVATTEYNADITTPIQIDLAGITGPLIGEQVAEKVVDALYSYTMATNVDQDVLSNSGILGVILGDYQRIYTKIDPAFNTATEIPLEESLDINNQFSPVDVVGATGVSQQEKDSKAGRVQIVGFKYKDTEYRAVIDILTVPIGLEIAIGNFQTRKTTWSTRRRSIQIDLKTLTGSSSVAQQTTAEELASVNASVGKAEASKSYILQKVYDKLILLDEAKKGFPTKWHSQI
jgi:hypothetical protein